MACDLTRGRKLPCKDVIGGIVRVYFIDFGDLGTVTKTDDEITGLAGTFNAYQYDLKGTNSLETAITSSLPTSTFLVLSTDLDTSDFRLSTTLCYFSCSFDC